MDGGGGGTAIGDGDDSGGAGDAGTTGELGASISGAGASSFDAIGAASEGAASEGAAGAASAGGFGAAISSRRCAGDASSPTPSIVGMCGRIGGAPGSVVTMPGTAAFSSTPGTIGSGLGSSWGFSSLIRSQHRNNPWTCASDDRVARTFVISREDSNPRELSRC